jgi:hypothetical protein
VRALLVLLLCPIAVFAVDRDLDDCTVGSTPTALAPLDLDNCTINDGDDITGILTVLASTYGNVYVRAPSRTANVVAAYTVFTVDDFYFLEDEDGRNTFLIQHKSVNPATCSGTDCKGYWVLWSIQNFDNAVIGGEKLSLTFVGNHPGLANCAAQYRPHIQVGISDTTARICDTNFGLVEFRMTDGSTGQLFDFRANVRMSQAYGLYSFNSSNAEGSQVNRVLQTNIAGLFYATSGVFLHAGSWDVWTDPDRFVLSDPYVRGWGWDGTVPLQGNGQPAVQAGLEVGCTSYVNDQVRTVGLSAYYSNSITGGMLVEWGTGGFAQRFPGRIGTAASPYSIRIKDWGITGPGTGYQAGVRVKGAAEALFSKGDPADNDPNTGTYRFMRLYSLPSQYGGGRGSASLINCAEDNNFPDGVGNFIRFEANEVGSRQTRWGQWELAGDFYTNWNWPAGSEIFKFGSSADESENFGHTLKLSSQTTLTHKIILRDRSTVTGPGTFADLDITDANAIVQGYNSTIIDTNVSGVMTVSDGTVGSVIRNVNFTGAARAVITVNGTADADIDDVCVPDGSTISGTSTTVNYEGSVRTLPYTIPNGTQNCSITADPRPGPVTGGSVN